MRLWAPKAKAAKTENDNRVRVITAIVFLLVGLLICRLFYVQVNRHGYYNEIADNQHLSSRSIEPARGRIFIQDDNGGELYPLATNKDFYIVFTTPKDVDNPELMSRQLYFIFDKDKIQKEVDLVFEQRVKEMTKTASATVTRELTDAEKKMLDVQKKDELKSRRDTVIKSYFDKLSKKDDPYEPIAEKVDDDGLARVYATILTVDQSEFYPDDEGVDKKVGYDTRGYFVKGDRVWKEKDGGNDLLVIKGLSQTAKSYRYYPEGSVGAQVLGFVGIGEGEMKGNYGLEGFFNEELTGVAGSLKAERAAGGNLIIVNDREYVKPKNGSDLILTIDRSIQFTACEKLNAAVLRHGADSGSVIVMDPKTGAILAMCSSPDFDPNNYKDVKDISVYNNQAVFSLYEPGSIFKVITMAMGLDQGKVMPDTTYEDKGVVSIAGYKIMNSDKQAHGVMTMTNVLEQSLNTGVIFVTNKVGLDAFNDYMEKFGFGEKTGIELEGEGKGDIRSLYIKKNPELYHYTASFGQGISVTALQMVSAFGAIANGGMMMKPYIVKEVVDEDGIKTEARSQEVRRVISEKAASLLGGMLVNVVENGHGKRAGVAGYYVGGKTGTAQVPRKDGRGYEASAHIGSFAGFAPIDDPQFVMIVRMDNPRDVDWAESSAAPLFGEIADFILHYKKIPPTRTIEEKK